MGDFRVSRGSTVIAASAATASIVEGVDYSANSAASAWIRITNTRLSGGGTTSGGGSYAPNEFSVWIANPSNIESGITFQRPTAAAVDCRVDWEVVEYVGNAGGPNEIVVRQEGVTSFGAGVSAIVEAPSIILPLPGGGGGTPLGQWSDVFAAAALITGQSSDGAAANTTQPMLFVSEIDKVTTGDITFRRGWNVDAAHVSWVALEFTGANWRPVQRDIFRSNHPAATPWTSGSPSNSGTRAIPSALLDAAKSFLHVQMMNSSGAVCGVDDLGENIELASSTTDFTVRRATSVTDSSKTIVVWVFENTQSGVGEMGVEHVAYHQSTTTGSEERTTAISIARLDPDQSSIFGECASALGVGPSVPQGFDNVSIDSDTTVGVTQSDVGVEERWSFDVVHWPTAPVLLEATPAELELAAESGAVQVATGIEQEVAELELEANAPIVQAAQSIRQSIAALVLEANAPIVQAAEGVEAPAAELELEAIAAAVESAQSIAPGAAELELEAISATVASGVTLRPTAAALVLEAHPASLSSGGVAGLPCNLPSIVQRTVELALEASPELVICGDVALELVLALEGSPELVLEPRVAREVVLVLAVEC